MQVHDRDVERAAAGQRVAVALPGVERSQLRRGDALVQPGAFPNSYRLDVSPGRAGGDPARSAPPRPPRDRRALRAGGPDWRGYAQLRLASPVVAARGDHVVLRDRTTLGGAVVLDPVPPRKLSPERLELIERGDIAATVHAPVRLDSLRHLAPADLDAVERAGEWLFSRSWLEALERDLRTRIGTADSLDPGVPVPSTAWAASVVPRLGLERRGAKLYLPGAAASLGDRADTAARLEAELEAAGYMPVPVENRELGAYLEREGRLVRVGDGMAVGAGAHEQARRLLVEECEREGSITLARFRDLLGTGRRPAQLLLERFDADGVTRRVGDARVLRRRASRA